ncbi:MAG: glucose-1-phosphate adenylyltransferase subunit GlgD [Oscillospiraceae bacterium]|nr:glucose-1-phosphate adenylyltransferase subunit GlgD [Oscillospiraceae bacterium]
MVNINALGIIFPNSYDGLIPELVKNRTMASVPFAGRYRMIDFCLSNMVHAGMENVTVIVKKNYHSLMDHLGNGREWDLSRKRGGLNIVPPYSQSSNKVYHGRVEALYSIIDFLQEQKEKYVIMSDCNVASDLDFAELVETHVKSGADVSMVYERSAIAEPIKQDNFTFTMDADNRVTELLCNDYRSGVQNLSLNVIVMKREELIVMIKDAMVRGLVYFERDILARSLQILNVRGVEYTGYRARVYDMKSYFDENIRLIDPQNLKLLFPEGRAVYTKVRDEAPVRYAMDCTVKNCLIADGCIIEGEVENCVLFRGVRVEKGAKVKNCVIMQGSQIHENAIVENAVLDKDVRVSAAKHLRGTDLLPVFVPKNAMV